VSYDFVNDIESYEEAVEVFDFDAHASTKKSTSKEVLFCIFYCIYRQHLIQYICSTNQGRTYQ